MTKEHATMRNTVLAAALGIAILGVARYPLAEAQEPPRKEPARASRGEIWKSETTGKRFRVRIEKGVFYAECVSFSRELTQKGAYIRIRLARVGSKWRGTSDISQPVAAGGSSHAPISNLCRITMRMEIDSMTADRITGQIEDPKAGAVDWEHCKILETDWKPFVWVRQK